MQIGLLSQLYDKNFVFFFLASRCKNLAVQGQEKSIDNMGKRFCACQKKTTIFKKNRFYVW